MNQLKRIITKFVIGITAIVLPMTGLLSCDNAIYEKLEPCRSGIDVRFIFDYNMLFANAFYSQVDCLTLFVYDSDYKYVTTLTETSSAALADENYKMTLNLPAGEYNLLAYGGMGCSNSSFYFSSAPVEGADMSSIQVEMNSDCIGADPGIDLHGLFYGALKVNVPEPQSNTFSLVTLPMMRDTHNIRILLQHVDGTPVNYEDFEITIAGADNFKFDFENNLIPSGVSSAIYPWKSGNVYAGLNPDGSEATLAFAEFSTSRLTPNSDMKLEIIGNPNEPAVVSIPLVNYLLLLKSEKYARMQSQEYLDRELSWDMIFFLDSDNTWMKTHILINNWVVRLNDAVL